jgi:adenylyltransferase/sulfurtransferase
MLPRALPPVPVVSPLEANQLLQTSQAVMIDVREPDEWNAARIPGAELRPMSQINSWYGDLPRDTTVIVQCRSGARSHAVVHALINQAGMDNVANLEGGIIAWAEDELPVVTGPE